MLSACILPAGLPAYEWAVALARSGGTKAVCLTPSASVFTARSNMVDTHVCMDMFRPSGTQTLVDMLKERCGQVSKPWLLPLRRDAFRAASDHRARLMPYVQPVLPPDHALPLWNDRTALVDRLLGSGVPCLPLWSPDPNDTRAAAYPYRFPAVLRDDGERSIVVFDHLGLDRALAGWQAEGVPGRISIQEQPDGQEGCDYLVHACVAEQGIPVRMATGRVLLSDNVPGLQRRPLIVETAEAHVAKKMEATVRSALAAAGGAGLYTFYLRASRAGADAVICDAEPFIAAAAGLFLAQFPECLAWLDQAGGGVKPPPESLGGSERAHVWFAVKPSALLPFIADNGLRRSLSDRIGRGRAIVASEAPGDRHVMRSRLLWQYRFYLKKRLR